MIELVPDVLEVPHLDVVVLRADMETGILNAFRIPASLFDQYPSTYDLVREEWSARVRFMQYQIWFKFPGWGRCSITIPT